MFCSITFQEKLNENFCKLERNSTEFLIDKHLAQNKDRLNLFLKSYPLISQHYGLCAFSSPTVMDTVYSDRHLLQENYTTQLLCIPHPQSKTTIVKMMNNIHEMTQTLVRNSNQTFAVSIQLFQLINFIIRDKKLED